jgi:hypothetical protein
MIVDDTNDGLKDGEISSMESRSVVMARRSVLSGAALIASLAIALMAGCTSTCTCPDDEEDDGYPVRSSPDSVIAKLQMAYVAMDAEAYLDCLAEDFVFHLNPDDYGDPGNDLPEWWGKVVEQEIHEAMFAEGSGVLSISLTLTNVSKSFHPGELPDDPSDDIWTYREQVDLFVSVEDPPDVIYHSNADQEFTLGFDPYDTGPDGETLWEIVDWWDLEERGECTTWGSIKSMYR